MTLNELFYGSCASYADRPAVSFVNGKTFSYAEMQDATENVINLLTRMGIKRGDKVAVLGANSPAWCFAYFAIVCSGAVVVPILPDFHTDEVVNIITHSESKAIFVSQRFHHLKSVLQAQCLNHIVSLEDFTVLRGSLIDATPQPVTICDDDLASIIYTSGTTGRSKGVMLSHRNITFNAEKCLSIQDVNENDVFLSILPLSHAYENTIGLILPIMQGSSIYYLEKPPTASVLLPALKKIRPTTMLSVPLVIEKLYRSQVRDRFNNGRGLKFFYTYITPFRKLVHFLAGIKLKAAFGGRLRFFGVGGAKLDGTVERFLREARFPYAIGYGLTETAPMLAGSNPSQTRLNSIGPVMEGVTIRLDNVDRKTGIGEVVATGDNVMIGYYKEPDVTRAAFTDDGWFRTGDLGKFDKHGRLYLRGRIKTMILRAGGENIYPEDIEAVLNNVRGVSESLVVEQKGRLVAMVHLNTDELEKKYQQAMADAAQYLNDRKEELNKRMADFLNDLRSYVNMHVNRFSQIQAVIIAPTPFEKTPTLKIKRYLYN